MCLCHGKFPEPEPVNPVIKVRQRYTLGPEDCLTEKAKLLDKISKKRIDFKDSQAALSEHGIDVLSNIASALFEFPEIDLELMGCFGTAGQEGKRRKTEHQRGIALRRAETCKSKLVELGVIGEICLNDTGREKTGMVKIAPTDPQLLSPQERLDRILSRTNFEFQPQTTLLNPKGLLVAKMCSRALLETKHNVIITCPKKSSELANKRADAISDALKDHGVTSDIVVKLASRDQDIPTITIDDKQDPQTMISTILMETPLAFTFNSCELVSDVLPVVKKIAEILAELNDVRILVEVYTGSSARKEYSDRRARELAIQRANRIVDNLLAEGTKQRLYPRGYSSSYVDGNLNSDTRGPRVLLTLLSPGDEEMEPLELHDDDSSVPCTNIRFGCM